MMNCKTCDRSNRFFAALAARCGLFLLSLALLFSSAVFSGCNSENSMGRLKVDGNVSLNGQPLENGQIVFIPDGSGTSSGGEIVDGVFTLPVSSGIPVGSYKVRITSFKETGETIIDPADMPDVAQKVTRQILPRRYNTDTELKLKVESGPVVANFDLTTN